MCDGERKKERKKNRKREVVKCDDDGWMNGKRLEISRKCTMQGMGGINKRTV